MGSKKRTQTRRLPVQARSRARVEAILESARDLLAERGVDHVSMTDIAKASGMSKAALYRYFSTKTEVIGQLSVQMIDEDRRWLEEALDEDVEDRVAAALAALADFGHRLMQDPYRVLLRAAIHADIALREQEQDDLTSIARMVTSYLDRVPESDVDPDRVLQILLVTDLVDGVVDLAMRVDESQRSAVIALYVEMARIHIAPS